MLISIFFFLEEHALKGALAFPPPVFHFGLGFVVILVGDLFILCDIQNFQELFGVFPVLFALGLVLGKQINQTQFLLVRSSQSGRLASPRGQITTVQFDKRDRYKVGQWRRGKFSA